VFVPRDRFSSSVRESIGDLLARTFDGYVAAFNPYFGDAALVRVHFIIGITPGAPEGPGVHALTQELRALVQNWSDRLFDELRIQNAGALPVALFNKYEKAFDAGYMARTRPNVAILDIDVLESMEERSTDQRVFRGASDPDCSVGIKLYHRGGPISLSNLIPSIENLGLDVIQEAGSDAHPAGSDETIWIHNFYTEERTGRAVEIDAVKGRIEETLCAILSGVTEDDGFNALVTLAGLHWREAWLLRATAKYALQTGFPFSQAYIEEALTAHPQIAASLVSVFHARFNPGGAANADDREAEVKAAEEKVITALEAVESLDEDRIIRRLLNIFAAMTRTNFYQRRADGGYKPMISFKIDSQRLAEIPEPKPYREIFVSGPRVDGVHLRFGPVSRGGLRWSDRREDFRTEVLGLVKAQRVKNAVIVPSGSKGGFYPKHLPTDGDRTAQQDEAREAYKIFISGLLDLTDNIVNGKTVSPPDIVRWDEPDPYLVVAADKGTATFSDTANEISQGYGFWLGDAFASGGSAGYDHKVMGITARGAWEAVKRHFREIGKDIQSEPFTVAGVGDMSGDVFGNGMLLSKQIKLVAAFDHRDIFIDPNPDPATSWEERDRLFKLGRSSWADYNTELISKGGGVFSRRSKSISLSPQAKKLLGLKSAKATPNEVIKAILKLEVELFWLGGIGTYFKSTREENWKVGDRANDSIRIDADEMRMNVIGEGANLGLTQMARIEFARQGGRVNTDAIDNSAGVDSSDHEVNIKILLATAIEKGELKSDDRDGLLKEMTEDVAHYVLRHNYDQTRGISLIERAAPQELDNHQRLIASLENEGRLDRSLEFLPNDKAIATLKASGHGLSRPELSVLVAYAKMKLFDELIDSPAPDDPQLERELFDYFPAQLHVYNHATVKHRLRREIIATRISNDVIDTCGAAFPHRIIEATGARYSDLALAYEAARRVLDLSDFASAVDDLDNQVPAAVQSDLYGTATELLGEYVYQILTNPECALLLEKKGVKALTDLYLAPVKDLRGKIADVFSDSTRNSFDDRLAAWQAEGVPEGLAREAGLMPALSYSLDIVDLARASGWQPHHVAAVFFAIGDRFQIQQARTVARDHLSTDHYDRLAIRRQVGDLTESQTALTRSVIERADAPPSMDASKEDTQWLEAIIEDWWTAFEVPARQTASFVAELDLSSGVSVGKMALFTRKLSDLISRAQLR
ncbi:MAG: NAD-glutamate dehydrogenase domain-containing protein, partial [Pseudomonadota bacterium]